MEKTLADLLPDTFVMPPYAIIVTLISLLNDSGLTDNVVKHCKTGLKILSIIYLFKKHDLEIDVLKKKEFDAFFKWLPDIYFNNRESIPVMMILENIDQCIKADKVVRVDS